MNNLIYRLAVLVVLEHLSKTSDVLQLHELQWFHSQLLADDSIRLTVLYHVVDDVSHTVNRMLSSGPVMTNGRCHAVIDILINYFRSIQPALFTNYLLHLRVFFHGFFRRENLTLSSLP